MNYYVNVLPSVVSAPVRVTLTATYNGATVTSATTVNPPTIYSVSPNPSALTGGFT